MRLSDKQLFKKPSGLIHRVISIWKGEDMHILVGLPNPIARYTERLIFHALLKNRTVFKSILH